MNDIVYLNGKFVESKDAGISPNDRGFLFADGIYEVIKYYQGRPFRMEDHITRLQRSLAEIDIKFSGAENLIPVFEKLLLENNLDNTHAGIYVQITRGVHKRIHHFPEKVEPTVYAYAFSLPSFNVNLENGIKVITQDDITSFPPDIILCYDLHSMLILKMELRS